MSYLSLERQREIQAVIDSIPALTGGVYYPNNSLIDVAKSMGVEVIIEDLDDDNVHIDGAMIRNKEPDSDISAYIFINS